MAHASQVHTIAYWFIAPYIRDIPQLNNGELHGISQMGTHCSPHERVIVNHQHDCANEGHDDGDDHDDDHDARDDHDVLVPNSLESHMYRYCRHGRKMLSGARGDQPKSKETEKSPKLC